MLKVAHWLIASILVLLAGAVQAGTDGVYILEGGSYSINAKFGNGTLTVIESNKESVYREIKPNVYEFTNPNNGISYWLTVVDDKTLQASKPNSSAAPTVLKLAAPVQIPESKEVNKKWEGIAEKYMDLVTSDPNNIQSWSACASTALAFAHQSEIEARAYAAQNAEMLKQILENPYQSPCPEVMPF